MPIAADCGVRVYVGAAKRHNIAPRRLPKSSHACAEPAARSLGLSDPRQDWPNRDDYLRAACASVAAFFAAVRAPDFSPACALASAVVNLAFVAESVVSGIAPLPSF